MARQFSTAPYNDVGVLRHALITKIRSVLVAQNHKIFNKLQSIYIMKKEANGNSVSVSLTN